MPDSSSSVPSPVPPPADSIAPPRSRVLTLQPLDPLPVTDHRNAEGPSLSLTADVVVVGSGAGGAVMAYELQKLGHQVVVVEAGSYVPSSEFTEKMAEMFGKLFQDKAAQTNVEGDFLVLQGRCVGGSTVVNGAVCFRIPDDVLSDWQRLHGLAGWTRERLEKAYEQVEGRLSVHVNEPHEINANSRILEKGCTALGLSWKPLSRNTKDCALTGFCVQGCASDRKQSMLVTYLPWAVEWGARIVADTTIETVKIEGGKAVGVSGVMRDPATGREIAQVSVAARVVVLAAGAIQTPVLLLKNGLGNTSGQVGMNFALHPSAVTLGRFDEDVFGYRGATLGSYCNEYEPLSKGGFILEGGTTGADALSALAPGYGVSHIEFMKNYHRMATMASLVHDENCGMVEWVDGRKKITYRLAESDHPKVRESFKVAARILFAAGAKEVFLPTYSPHVMQRPDEIDALVDGLDLGPSSVFWFSYHPQGTCRMGVDPSRSVVSPTGETHDVKQLYIADASLFPTSILVNPQMTVYALSTLIAEHVHEDGLGGGA